MKITKFIATMIDSPFEFHTLRSPFVDVRNLRTPPRRVRVQWRMLEGESGVITGDDRHNGYGTTGVYQRASAGFIVAVRLEDPTMTLPKVAVRISMV